MKLFHILLLVLPIILCQGDDCFGRKMDYCTGGCLCVWCTNSTECMPWANYYNCPFGEYVTIHNSDQCKEASNVVTIYIVIALSIIAVVLFLSVAFFCIKIYKIQRRNYFEIDF